MTSRQSGMRRQGKKKSALVVGWLWRVGALLGSCAGCWEGGFAGSWDIKRADTSHRGPPSPGCGISMRKKEAQVRKSGRILPLHENSGNIEAVAVAWGIGASTTSRSSSRHHLTIHRKEGALADLERWIVTGGARGARDNPRERKGRAPGGQIAAGCPRFLPSRDPQPRLSWQELHSSMHTTGKVREIIPACPAQGFFLSTPSPEAGTVFSMDTGTSCEEMEMENAHGKSQHHFQVLFNFQSRDAFLIIGTNQPSQPTLATRGPTTNTFLSQNPSIPLSHSGFPLARIGNLGCLHASVLAI